jgi:hypothetical protein
MHFLQSRLNFSVLTSVVQCYRNLPSETLNVYIATQRYYSPNRPALPDRSSLEQYIRNGYKT